VVSFRYIAAKKFSASWGFAPLAPDHGLYPWTPLALCACYVVHTTNAYFPCACWDTLVTGLLAVLHSVFFQTVETVSNSTLINDICQKVDCQNMTTLKASAELLHTFELLKVFDDRIIKGR